MSTFREKAEAQTEQVIGQMLGDELLVREGQSRLRKADSELNPPRIGPRNEMRIGQGCGPGHRP